MEFERGKPAIVTEIYLPAKHTISPKFLEALDGSLSPERVEAHFGDNTQEARIKEFLPDPLKERYADLRQDIKDSQRSFGGYSLYDVKGAWISKEIERDANACIRIIDWPTPDRLFRQDPDLCQRVIRTVFALRLHHDARPDISSLLQVEKGAVDEICRALDKWIDEGSFLLYGFLMYHLGQLTGGLESAILLTSHFAVVNQYRQTKQPSLAHLSDSSSHMVSTAVRTEARTGDVDISKEGAVPFECIPKDIIIQPGELRWVAVTIEVPTTNIEIVPFAFDQQVVDVRPNVVHLDAIVNGVAEFEIWGRQMGVTSVSFSATGGKTCNCKILVTNARPELIARNIP
jgi:hypothetical protein